ncbi:MAG: hypothetical protein EZS28_027627 [Streblomastix strix]|uniref:Uncharacterized protein n=1 Tax=Streblomastix strix TaxID=222440 RepID=A0A5J4V1J9_9EUKA|nr:MAG: hypothetical protein EZS28_027627 [Streblomastix strix]
MQYNDIRQFLVNLIMLGNKSIFRKKVLANSRPLQQFEAICSFSTGLVLCEIINTKNHLSNPRGDGVSGRNAMAS